jgi:hypothetical protein
MAMNPFEQRGMPERQVRTWKEVVVPPYGKHDVDAFTRGRKGKER